MDEKEFKELVSYAVEEIVNEKSKKGFIERLAGITAFVASLGAFAGAVVAISSAWDTLSKQEKIEEVQSKIEVRQILLEANQKKLDENARLSRLSNTQGKFCAQIPLDEVVAWERYLKCLEEGNVTNSLSDDPKRLVCIEKYSPCR